MKLIALIARLRPRPTHRRPLDPVPMSVREWADLPVHHPNAG